MDAYENSVPIKITYFVPDKRKAGGSYKRVRGKIKKWDEYDRKFTMDDGCVIYAGYISDASI